MFSLHPRINLDYFPSVFGALKLRLFAYASLHLELHFIKDLVLNHFGLRIAKETKFSTHPSVVQENMCFEMSSKHSSSLLNLFSQQSFSSNMALLKDNFLLLFKPVSSNRFHWLERFFG